MKIVFLDLDGVLNSSRTHVGVSIKGMSSYEIVKATIDPIAVAMVNRLCYNADAKIVISSSHRYDFMSYTEYDHKVGDIRKVNDMDGLKSYFGSLGIPSDRIVGATADIMRPGRVRGDEIQHWLDEHPEVTEYVILDDVAGDYDRPEFPGLLLTHFVRVDDNEGFRYKDFLEAQAILKVEVSPFILPY